MRQHCTGRCRGRASFLHKADRCSKALYIQDFTLWPMRYAVGKTVCELLSHYDNDPVHIKIRRALPFRAWAVSMNSALSESVNSIRRPPADKWLE
jgi:hypothetical protein